MTKTTTTYETKVFISIERPNGQIEDVDVTGKFMSPIAAPVMAKIAAETAKAGRGKVLGQHSTTTHGTRELSDIDLIDRSYEATVRAMTLNNTTK